MTAAPPLSNFQRMRAKSKLRESRGGVSRLPEFVASRASLRRRAGGGTAWAFEESLYPAFAPGRCRRIERDQNHAPEQDHQPHKTRDRDAHNVRFECGIRGGRKTGSGLRMKPL